MAIRLSTVLLALFRILLAPAVFGLTYLYFYPVLAGCAFPAPGPNSPDSASGRASLRLLALADPQLEGDTSLPSQSSENLEGIWQSLRDGDLGKAAEGLGDVLNKDVPRLLQSYRKSLDLWGNDLYLAHIYSTVKFWTAPTQAVVLGDLLGSQWIGDEEFERRADRFWGTVFQGSRMRPYGLTNFSGRSTMDIRPEDGFNPMLILPPGNHDVGYAGDLDERRVERFEERFGKVNWETRLRPPISEEDALSWGGMQAAMCPTPLPEIRMVVLNSMNLDEPAYKSDLRAESLDFSDSFVINSSPEPNNKTAMLLLTHIPLHKEEGVCVDSPYFSYFPPHEGGGIREQNHLSKDVSHKILDGLAKYGSAIVLNGHDHEGCDTYHYRTRSEQPPADAVEAESGWEAQHSSLARSRVGEKDVRGVREVTVRSMMGSYGGNAGLLSAWFDDGVGRWQFAYDTCPFGVQHIWWALNVLCLVVLGLGFCGLVARLSEGWEGQRGAEKRKKA